MPVILARRLVAVFTIHNHQVFTEQLKDINKMSQVVKYRTFVHGDKKSLSTISSHHRSNGGSQQRHQEAVNASPNISSTAHVPNPGSLEDHFYFDPVSSSDDQMRSKVIKTMLVYPNFITQEEETSLMKEIEPYISRLHYEGSHWDDAIHDYRETERSTWNKKNSLVISRIRNTAFPPGIPQLKLVHILDLAAQGVIKPHIDSVRFCGDVIAGLSILSDSVMRLKHDIKKDFYCDVFLPRLSLYVMSDFARYELTHEILGEDESKFKGSVIQRNRRISIVCRNEPPDDGAPPSAPEFVSLHEI